MVVARVPKLSIQYLRFQKRAETREPVCVHLPSSPETVYHCTTSFPALETVLHTFPHFTLRCTFSCASQRNALQIFSYLAQAFYNFP